MASLARRYDDSLSQPMQSMWHMLDTVLELALAHPESPVGQTIIAMDWWRNAISQGDKVAIDNLMAMESNMPWEESRFTDKNPRQWPVKGFIPNALFKLLSTFYPGFHRDEDFLDEFFVQHPLGQRLANPCWRPKPVSERISRGVSPYAYRVQHQLADGSYEPLIAHLRRPLIAGGERTAGA